MEIFKKFQGVGKRQFRGHRRVAEKLEEAAVEVSLLPERVLLLALKVPVLFSFLPIN